MAAADGAGARVRRLLGRLREECAVEAGSYASAVRTLCVLCRNAAKSPSEPKYCVLSVHRGKLASLVGRWEAALEVLEAAGFARGDGGEMRLGAGGAAADAVDALAAARSAAEAEEERLEADRRAEERAARAGGFSHAKEEEEAAAAKAEAAEAAAAAAAAAVPSSMFDVDERQREAELEAAARAASARGGYDLDAARRSVARDAYPGASDEEYAAALATLLRVTANLAKTGAERRPAFRDLNTANERLRERALRFPGATQYLEFVGFRAAGGGRAVLAAADEDPRRTERAHHVLKQAHAAATTERVDRKPVPRELRVFRTEAVGSGAAARLPPPDAEAGDGGDTEMRDARGGKDKVDPLMMRVWADSDRRQKEEARFGLKRDLEEARRRMQRRYDRTVVRVRFVGDKVTLQASFNPNEPLSALFGEVRARLSDERRPFYLRLPPTERVEERSAGKRSFQEARCVPSAVFVFRWSDGAADAGALSPDTLAMCSDEVPAAAEVPRAVNLSEIEEARGGAGAGNEAARGTQKSEAELAAERQAEEDAAVEALMRGGAWKPRKKGSAAASKKKKRTK